MHNEFLGPGSFHLHPSLDLRRSSLQSHMNNFLRAMMQFCRVKNLDSDLLFVCLNKPGTRVHMLSRINYTRPG